MESQNPRVRGPQTDRELWLLTIGYVLRVQDNHRDEIPWALCPDDLKPLVESPGYIWEWLRKHGVERAGDGTLMNSLLEFYRLHAAYYYLQQSVGKMHFISRHSKEGDMQEFVQSLEDIVAEAKRILGLQEVHPRP